MKSDNFENIIKNTIQNVEIEPPQEVWTNISKKMFFKTLIKISFFTVVGLSIILIFGVLSFYKFEKKVSISPLNYNININSYRTPVPIIENRQNKIQLKSTIVRVQNTKVITNNNFTINSFTNSYIQNIQKNSKKWTIDKKISRNDEKSIYNSENNNSNFSFLPLPKAIFEFSMPIYSKTSTEFLSRSQNSTNYKWFVNYELKSTDSVFEYSFPKADIYIVTLIASNIQGLNDTVSHSVVALEPDKYIVFPNAFCPNTSGTSGGYYNENMKDNTVFRPFVYSKEVVQYKLTIMNRSGQIIYTSQELSKGWDGYCNNRIVPVGVYLFVAEGKFDDGQNFKEAGSITVLY